MSERLSTSDFVAAGQSGTAVAEPDEARIDTAKPDGARPSGQTALFGEKECHDFRSRWDEIQLRFVDDPKKATEEADNLVAETMRRLAEIFADERKNMESQWSRGDNVSTEDMRLALQRYRSFFNRLLLI
jgi:hypothetical protein